MRSFPVRSLTLHRLARRSLATALLSTTAMLITTGLASAENVDEAGARTLEAQVPAVLDYMFSSSPDIRYTFDGNVVATPDGDSYSVAIPGVTVNVNRDVQAEFPAFNADVTPQDNGWQRAQWDFPGSFTITNPGSANEQADITFTSEGNMMTFAPEYGMALIADVNVDNLSVRVQGQEGVVTLESMAMDADSEPSGEGPDSYNSDTILEASNFLIDIPQEKVFLEIGAITMQGTTTRQRLDLFAILQENLDGVDPESTAFAETFLGVLREHGEEKWLGDAYYSSEMNDLAFTIEDVSGTLGSTGMTIAAEGLDQPNAQLGLRISMDDTSSPDLPGQFSDVIPSSAELDISAADAPLEPILNEIYAALDGASEPEFGLKGRRAGTGSTAGGLENLDPMALLGIVLESDALLEINSLFVEAPIGYISADGTIDPDPAAAFQAVAEISLDVAGLPDMISFAQQMGGDAAQASGMISVIAAMGRDGTDDEGTAIKEFDFQLTASGEMLLNGNDLSAMMGMFQ